MNNKSVNRIITAKDYGGSARGYIRRQQQALHARGVAVQVDDTLGGVPVKARIWQGQWIADCECSGASFVDPQEPVFFCFGCGNRIDNGCLRPVDFPADYAEIERLILERPVNDVAGLTDMERAGLAKPLLANFPRSWNGESLDELHAMQDAAIQEWRNNVTT